MSARRIIITLSRSDIKMAYSSDDPAGGLSPFPGASWPMPLKKFGGKEALPPEFLIGKGVEGRIQQLVDEGIIEGKDEKSGLKEKLQVVLLAENDISDAEADKAVADLVTWGFVNVRLSRPDVLLTRFYLKDNDYRGVVIAGSNDADLSVSLFKWDAEGRGELKRHLFKGEANESRVDAVAQKIWDLVKDQTIDLRLETELRELRKVAREFLATNDSELSGSVRLSDGECYPFFLRRSTVKNLIPSDNALQTKFTKLLLENGMADRSCQALILRNEAVDNNYLHEMLAGSFAKVEEEKGSLAEAFSAYIASLDWSEIGLALPQRKVTAAPGNVKENVPENTGASQGKPADEYEKKTEGKQGAPAPVAQNKLIPVTLLAKVEKIKYGIMNLKTKKVLKIDVGFPQGEALPWKSVLCVQDGPLSKVEERNIVKVYPEGEKPPFSFEIELPLKAWPKAKTLRVYFYPHPDEPVGINNAYEYDAVSVKVS